MGGSFLSFSLLPRLRICTNTRRLEAGQSLIIAIAILVHNLLQLNGPFASDRIARALSLSISLSLPVFAPADR
jgi:hypothetical protein